MNKALIFLVPVLLAGCISKPPLSLEHIINVPDLHRWGGSLHHDLGKNTFRYNDSFEQAYWQCIKEYTEDIDYEFDESHTHGNGWASAIFGYHDGYIQAHERVQALLKSYKKGIVHNHLKSYWIDSEDTK